MLYIVQYWSVDEGYKYRAWKELSDAKEFAEKEIGSIACTIFKAMPIEERKLSWVTLNDY